MSETVLVTIENTEHQVLLSAPRSELYDFCEGLTDFSIQKIVWNNARTDSSENLFFWLARKLLPKLQFEGQITLNFAENFDYSGSFFFPADCLGAIVSPVVNTTNQYGVKLGGIHYGGIAE